MEDSGGYTLHEPDEWFPGLITAIEETPDTGYGPGLKWVIQLDDQDDADFDKWAFCSQKLSPKSKLYSWLLGLGANPNFGDEVDLDPYVGRRIQVMFETFEKDGSNKEKIVKIRAEKAKGDLQEKQTRAAAAKDPKRDTTEFVNPDEAPF